MEVNGLDNVKIYIPTSTNYACCYVSGSNINCLRTYNSNSYNTRDSFNVDFSYLMTTDSVYIGNNTNYNCISSSRITHDVFYRLDLDKILVSYFIIILIPSVFIWLLHKRFRKRF